MIMLSRIILGLHYPTDVVIAALIGSFALSCWALCLCDRHSQSILTCHFQKSACHLLSIDLYQFCYVRHACVTFHQLNKDDMGLFWK